MRERPRVADDFAEIDRRQRELFQPPAPTRSPDKGNAGRWDGRCAPSAWATRKGYNAFPGYERPPAAVASGALSVPTGSRRRPVRGGAVLVSTEAGVAVVSPITWLDRGDSGVRASRWVQLKAGRQGTRERIAPLRQTVREFVYHQGRSSTRFVPAFNHAKIQSLSAEWHSHARHVQRSRNRIVTC
jgi:hypothetical protein